MSRRALRRVLPVLVSIVALTASTSAAAAPATPEPARSCTVSVSLPAKVTIDRAYREVKATLNDPCTRVDYASSYLYGKDGMDAVFIFDGTRTDYWDVYSWNTIGSFRTRDTAAYDREYDRIPTKETTTKVKYGSKGSLSSKRNGTKVTLNADVRAYSPAYDTFRGWSAPKATLQVKSGSTWKYVRTVTLGGGKGSVTLNAPRSATYRLFVADDWARWGTHSNTTTR